MLAFLSFCFIYGLLYAFFTPYLLVGFGLPLLALLLMVIWALPQSRAPPTRALEFLFFAFIISLVVWPNYLALSLPGLPWITVARLTGYPLAFLLLVCLSTSEQFRRVIGDGWSDAPVLRNLFLAFTALTIVSILFSSQKAFSFQKLLVAQTNWTAIFVVAIYVFHKPGRADRMIKALWASAIFVGIIGVMEWRVQHVLWAGHIPSFLKISDQSVQDTLAVHMRLHFGPYRSVSTFTTPLGFGEYLAITLPFVVHYAFNAKGRILRLAARISVPFILFVAWVSGSRLGMIGCLIAVGAYCGIWAFLRWRRDRNSLLAAVILLAYPLAATTFALATLFVGRVRHIVWGTGAQGYSDQARQDQIHMGIPLILKHPWGYGIGRGAETLGYAPFGFLTIDNYYLAIVLEYGVVGFIIYYGMFLAAVFYSGKRIVAERFSEPELELIIPAAIALVNFVMIKSVFSEEGNHPIVFMMLGMVVAFLHRIRLSEKTAEAATASQAAPIYRAGRRLGTPTFARSSFQ